MKYKKDKKHPLRFRATDKQKENLYTLARMYETNTGELIRNLIDKEAQTAMLR